MTTDEKIELLTKDFLERDEKDHFVRIRRTDRLGWESTLPEGGAYSDFILHTGSQEELIKNAYRIAGDMIKVMDAPFKVNVKITQEQSCTDSKNVLVATKVFDDPDLPAGQKLDTFIGLAVHEGCHLLYTDFTMKDKDNVVNNLSNIIEDERIERECGERKPGLANFLKAAKYYHFDKYVEEMKKTGKLKDLDTFRRLMNCIISFVRYPKSLDINDLKEFADVMLDTRRILTPFPQSTQESHSAAVKIRDLIKEFLKDKEDEENSETENSRPQKGNGDTSESVNEKMDKGINEMQSALNNITGQPEKAKLDENEISDVLKMEDGKVGSVCEGKMERGIMKGAFIERAQEDKDTYMESLDRVKKYIPAINRALKYQATEYKLTYRGMRSGVLDTNKLAEAYQGVPTVYIKEGEVKTDRICVCILLDESGSMWGANEMAARDTAVLLNEALGDIPNIDLNIYGHTATTKTMNLYVYREGGEGKRYALGSTDSRVGNHDAVAIREACARIRKHTDDKCLFFMISDGAPNESTELVKKTVDEMEKQGFDIIAISIDPYYDPSTMYRHNVTLTDLSALAPELGKMVKKAVIDNTRKKVC